MPISRELLESINNNSFREPLLNLGSQSINDQDIEALVEALKNNTHIRTIDLSDNLIKDKGAIALSRISHIKNLDLDLSTNMIGPIGAKSLAEGNFESLTLNGNPLGDEGISAFRDNTILLHLKADQCNITDAGATQVFKNKKLIRLSLQINKITDKGVAEVPNNYTLQELDLSHNFITGVGAGSISQNQSIRILYLAKNSVEDVGAEKIAFGKFKLEELDLSSNSVTDRGAYALSRHETLTKLFLFNNKIGSNGAKELFKMNLTTLKLAFNQVDESCVTEATNANKRIDIIDLDGNPIAKAILISFTSKKNMMTARPSAYESDQRVNINDEKMKF